MNAITLILVVTEVIGFFATFGYLLLASRFTGVGSAGGILVCAILWFPLALLYLALRYLPAGPRQIPLPEEGDNYSPADTYTLVHAMHARGFDTADTATDEALTRTAHEIGLPEPGPCARQRLRNLTDIEYPTIEQ